MFFSDIIHLTGIYNPVTLSYEVWDGSLSVGGVTIGQVDQGAPGALAWKVDGSGVTQPVSIAASVPVTSATLATEATLGTRLTETDFDTKTGSLTETAPVSDTASSGLNGRLQRIAQRLTSLIALLPTSLGQGTMAQSLKVVLPSDQSAVPVSGTLTAVTTITNPVAVTNANLDAPLSTLTTAVNTLLKPANTLTAVTTVGTITNPVTVNVGLTDAQLRAAAVPVAGAKSHNAGVPGATNLGTLPAIATVAAPTYVEGNQVGLSTDLTGAIRITGSISATSAATATADDPTYTEGVAEELSQDLGGRLRTLAYGLGETIPSDMAPEGECTPLKTDRQGRLWIASDTLTAQFNRQIELLMQLTIEMRINNELLSAGLNLRENLDLYRSDQSISGNVTLN